MNLKKDGAFTVFEVLAVLVLVALLYFLILPGLAEFQQKLEEKTGLARVTEDLAQARAEALGRGCPTKIEFFPDKNFYIFSAGNISIKRPLPGLRFSGEKTEIIFDPVSLEGKELYFQGTARFYKIKINKEGETRTEIVEN